jgi:hypothetical protein
LVWIFQYFFVSQELFACFSRVLDIFSPPKNPQISANRKSKASQRSEQTNVLTRTEFQENEREARRKTKFQTPLVLTTAKPFVGSV